MGHTLVTGRGLRGSIPARVFLLFARAAPVAVVFRRGPSRWAQVLIWHTDTDVFEPGQWFHGRIYERRADLTPDGSLLIYFASKFNAKTLNDRAIGYSWSAISKPPYLTALALWPKNDCWHGGGSFLDNQTVVLNHPRDRAAPHPEHLPGRLRVLLKKDVCGEDDPLFSERLVRDGWRLEREWRIESCGPSRMFRTIQPEIRTKERPGGAGRLRLTRSVHGLAYSEEFTLFDGRALPVTLDGASWADWDQQGRLVFAAGGQIRTGALMPGGAFVQRVLLDLNSSKPRPVAAPDWATHW